MSAPGHPKRESLTLSGTGESITAPGRLTRESLSGISNGELIDALGCAICECSGSRSSAVNHIKATCYPRRESLKTNSSASAIGMPHDPTRESGLCSGRAVR